MPRHIIHHPRYLGENLKRLRRARDWTVERLAGEAGVSKGYLSLIETGKRSPHWSVTMRIIHALGESLCSFFTSAEALEPAEDGIRTRRSDLIVIEGEPPCERGGVASLAENRYTYILTPYHPELRSEIVEIHLPPHTAWTPEPIAFGGHVSCWGAAGRLLLESGGSEYAMLQGETLQYDASIPHTLRNYTDHPTKALLTIAPACF